MTAQLILKVHPYPMPEPEPIDDPDWTRPVWAWFDHNTQTDRTTNHPAPYSAIRYVLEGKARKLRVVPA